MRGRPRAAVTNRTQFAANFTCGKKVTSCHASPQSSWGWLGTRAGSTRRLEERLAPANAANSSGATSSCQRIRVGSLEARTAIPRRLAAHFPVPAASLSGARPNVLIQEDLARSPPVVATPRGWSEKKTAGTKRAPAETGKMNRCRRGWLFGCEPNHRSDDRPSSGSAP